MKITAHHKIRSICRGWLHCASAAWLWARAGSGALALCVLWLLPGSCRAIEPLVPASAGAGAISSHGIAPSELAGSHGFDYVMVEQRGRGPEGFQFKIVLDSVARGAESSLELAANAAGLLVTARDVDGIGNDLDLIVKSADSYIPIGIWVNDHHGGFIKVDNGVYSASIWSESPQLLSLNITDTVCRALLPWHQSPFKPPAEGMTGERWIYDGRVERPDHDLPSRLRADPNQTRGPPSVSTQIHD